MYIQKVSGERELFSLKKFTESLRKAGADDALIAEITDTIQQQLDTIKSTKQLYGMALNYLQNKNPVIACRYNLKKALFLLGPTGFPFEQFVARIFMHQGFEVVSDQIIQGKCVEHEIDVIATKNKQRAFVECKFHQASGLKVDVTVSLYVKARFDDVVALESQQQSRTDREIWLATNAKFTSETIRYAQCVDIRLLGWSYPIDNNIQTLIDRFGLHPITVFPHLSVTQKKYLVKHGLVFCKDIAHYRSLLTKMGFNSHEIEQLIKEAHKVCNIG